MNLWEQEGSSDDIFGLAVGELTADLVSRVHRVQGGHHQTCLGSSQEGDDVVRTVWHHDCQDIAFAGTKAKEAICESSGKASGLREGQLGSRGSVDQGRVFAELRHSAPAHGWEGYWRNSHLSVDDSHRVDGQQKAHLRKFAIINK